MVKDNTITAENIVTKVEEALQMELSRLPETLSIAPPEKRIDFVTKVLPMVMKYREDHSSGWGL